MGHSLPYLDAFASIALPLLKGGRDFPSFRRALSKKVPKTPIPLEYDDILVSLEECRRALLVVYSVISNPAIKSTTESSVSRSELIGSLPPNSLISTMKEPSFWREKDGSMAPEYVHYEESTDTIVRYENLFVARLIILIEQDARRAENELLPILPSFEGTSERRGASFGAKGPFADFAGKDAPYGGFFPSLPTDASKAIALARLVRKMVKHIKGTEFYRILSKEKPLVGEITPTNVLLHDSAYNRLYKFYEGRYRGCASIEGGVVDVLYYDYALMEILTALEKRGIDLTSLTLTKDPSSDRMRFSPISFEFGPLRIDMNEERDALGVILAVKLKLPKKGGNPLEAKYRLLFVKDFDEDNEKVIFSSLMDPNYEFDDTFLIAMSDSAKSYDRVLSISYYDKDNEGRVDRLLASLSLIFECDPSYFEDRCPVCGAPHPSFGVSGCVCGECHSRFALIGNGKRGHVWIKSLRKDGGRK